MRRFAGRAVLAIGVIGTAAFAVSAAFRIARVATAGRAIPVYPGGREGGGHTRYWPHLISWDDRSSARVDRVFALPKGVNLVSVGRRADATLASQGWYLVTPEVLNQRFSTPQVIVWQRDPDERLDLTQLWPLDGMSRTERLYGGIFPAEFLDAPLVLGWTWSLGGPRSPHPAPPQRPIVRWPSTPTLPDH